MYGLLRDRPLLVGLLRSFPTARRYIWDESVRLVRRYKTGLSECSKRTNVAYAHYTNIEGPPFWAIASTVGSQ